MEIVEEWGTVLVLANIAGLAASVFFAIRSRGARLWVYLSVGGGIVFVALANILYYFTDWAYQ